MNKYMVRILSVIQKFRMPLLWDNCIETSAFIKFNMKTSDRIQNIMKYENEFQSMMGEKIWLEAKNGFISICIPKDDVDNYSINEILESDFYNSHPSPLKIALGETPDGGMVVGDLEKWINVLIAGVPGSGKSNLLNVMINCFSKVNPSILNLVLFDLKQVELTQYNCLPHLKKPVITDIINVQNELLSIISEMKKRYSELEKHGCRNIQKYNSKVGGMPYLVVIIDELAEIILSQKDCENQIIRLAQKGRACGIHLIIATQKPNTDIVTPLIKGSIDTRISFHVASHYDSQVILDQSGAEKLGKHGDMLLRDEDGLQRIQCCYISDDEIEENLKRFNFDNMNFEYEVHEEVKEIDYIEAQFEEVIEEDLSEFEQLYKKAIDYIMETRKCNEWVLKNHLHIGKAKANEILDKLYQEGYISKFKVGKDHEILKGEF